MQIAKNNYKCVMTTIATIFIFGNVATAQSMEPLNQRSLDGVEDLIYVFERCSGLFGSLYKSTRDFDSPDASKVAKAYLDLSTTSTPAAIIYSKEAGKDMSFQQSEQNTLIFVQKYDVLMDKNYRDSGNAISPMVVEDTSFCIMSVKAFKDYTKQQ